MAPQPETTRLEVTAAQALLSSLTELSSRAGHDLVGPLNQAGTLLALFIRRNRNQPDSEADKLLEFLEGASARMECVAAGVRKYMEIASRPPSPGPVDLNSSLSASLSLLKKEISESGAVIVSDSLPVVSADAIHMVMLFEILIGNAIKFRLPGTVPRVQVSSRAAGELRSIVIADYGIGIDPEYTETVFLPFKRLNGREYDGAGLGLATAKLIAGMHGSDIRIDSILHTEPAPQTRDSARTHVRFLLQAE